jgi:general secretion pathway protein D
MNTRRRSERNPRCRTWIGNAGLAFIGLVVVAALADFAPRIEPAIAQEVDGQEAVSLEAKLDQKGTIILRDATLSEWLFAIQQEWGVDIVAGNELQRDVVNGGFTDATLREVLTSILYSRGFGYRQVGKSLLIMHLDDMTIKPDQRTVLLPLDYLNPQEVEASVQLLLSQTGQVQAIPSSQSLFVIDSPEVIERIREFLTELESNAQRSYEREQQREREREQALNPTEESSASDPVDGVDIIEIEEHVRVFEAKYVSADALAEAIQAVLVDARVSPIADGNKIVVVASADSLVAAEKLLAEIDVPRRQVRITAYMYDVNVELMERLGFNWSHSARGRINGSGDPQSLFELNNQAFPVATSGGGTDGGGVPGMEEVVESITTVPSTTGGLFTLSNLTRHFDLTTTIQALEQCDGARLLARPNIMAYDRVVAVFQSVQEIPVQQLTQTSEGGDIGTTEFREAGITLTVTPQIMADDTIVLDVSPEFSILSGFSADGQPIIDRRTATTKLMLRDGEASVIGGLVRRNEFETQRGIPGIKDWKFIGILFRDHETTITESELVVFIRAEIVDLSFPGDPRDQMALQTVDQLVEQIPYATPAHVLESCCDPYCPLCCPRPRIVNEFPGDFNSSGVPMQQHDMPIQPQPQHQHQQVPPYQEFEPLPPQAPNATPGIEPQRLPDVELTIPPDTQSQPATEQPIFEPVHDVQVPPPVIVDELARRHREGRVRMSRLPELSQEAQRQAQQAPIVVRPSRQAATPTRRDSGYRTAELSTSLLPPTTQTIEPTPPSVPETLTAPRKNWLENIFAR